MSAARWIRGRERVQIMEHIADNEMSYDDIARKFNRNGQTIKDFAHDNKIEIEQLKADHADALKSLWIARKELRLAEAQADYERLDAWLQDLEDAIDDEADSDEREGKISKLAVMDVAGKHLDRRQKLRREVAEECGHLMTRLPNSGPPPEPVEFSVEREEK